MASIIAITIAGALLNSTAFIGGSYLMRTLTSDKKHTDNEKRRHDLALEAYQLDMGKYEKSRQEYQDWLNTEYLKRKQASNQLTNTDQAFVLYSRTHKDINLKEPELGDYYKPSSTQKKYELVYVGVGMLGTGFLVSRFL